MELEGSYSVHACKAYLKTSITVIHLLNEIMKTQIVAKGKSLINSLIHHTCTKPSGLGNLGLQLAWRSHMSLMSPF